MASNATTIEKTQTNLIEQSAISLVETRFSLVFSEFSKRLESSDLEFNEKKLLHILKSDVQRFWINRLQRCLVLEFNALKEKGIFETDQPLYEFSCLLSDPSIQDELLQKYPVLNQQMSVFSDNLRQALNKMLDHLHADITRIKSELLNLTTADDLILDAIYFLGDAHNHFQRVALLQFVHQQNILRVIYKPRAMDTDEAFIDFVNWINKYLTFPLKALQVLSDKDHGWCEYIEFKKVQSEHELSQFYWRFGALIATCYLFNIHDIHHENLIAHGKHPVILDLECFLKPELIFPKQASNLPLPQSVYTSDLLTGYMFGEEGAADVSALTGGLVQDGPFHSPKITYDAAGNIKVEQMAGKLSGEKNRPAFGENIADPLHYQVAILDGFSTAYQAMLNNQDSLLSALTKVNNLKTRIIFKPTATYSQLLEESYHPKSLYSASNYRSHLAWLKKNKYLNNAQIANSEIKQLMQNDVPAFYWDSNTNYIYDAYHQRLSIRAKCCGIDYIKHRLSYFSESDYQLQIQLIENSLIAKKHSYPHVIATEKRPNQSVEMTYAAIKEQAKSVSQKILTELMAQAFQGDYYFWPTFSNTRVNHKEYWNAGITHLDLYSGLAGILIPYAYAATYHQDKMFLNFVSQGLLQIEAFLDYLLLQKVVPISVFGGIGGILYLCAILDKLNKHHKHALFLIEALVEKLDTLLKNKLASCLKHSNEFDLISGSAGTLIALQNASALLQTNNLDGYLNQCRQHILSGYKNPAILPKKAIKPGIYERAMLGMGHGVSGIALALHSAFPDDLKTKKWIRSALAYERRFFDNIEKDWPNFTGLKINAIPSKQDYQCDWCHGALGIGMNRLGLLRQGWIDNQIEDEISSACSCVTQHEYKNRINLCHGALSVADFYLLAKKQKMVTEQHYHHYTASLVNACQKDNLQTDTLPNIAFPGLMTGKAGAALQLLRIAHEDAVGSVLMLELPKL